jgi:hypothetical protein
MASPFGGGDLGDGQVYNPTVEALTFWDLSESPTTNDRIKKLGAELASRAQALADYDEKAHVGKYADALQPDRGQNQPVVTLRLFEPDNWVPRLHEENGRGKDSVWALRFISDHSNYAKERECRSTMVIDQDEKAQSWAWLSDVTWLVDLGTSVEDNELAFNGAGFLTMLYATGKPIKKRAALAINMAGNAGFLTQGTAIGQLQHVLCIVGAGQGTLTRPTKQTEAALRGDVHFFTQKGLAQFYHEQEKTKDVYTDEAREVHFYVSEKDAPDLGLDATDDLLSNHKKIPRLGAKQWRGWVKVPRSGGGDTKYDYSWHKKTRKKPSSGGGGGAGTATEGHGDRAPTSNASGNENPDGKARNTQKDTTNGVPTYDASKYVLIGGVLVPIFSGAAATQVQYGSPEASSPAWCQDVNIFPHEDGTEINPTASWECTKGAGYTDIAMELMVKVSDAITPGERLTLDIKVMFLADDTPQAGTEIYGRRIELDDSTPSGSAAAYSRITAYFSGFPKEEGVFKVWLERRCDDRTLDPTYDADVEAWVMRSMPAYY